jgi:hypothetical protein
LWDEGEALPVTVVLVALRARTRQGGDELLARTLPPGEHMLTLPAAASEWGFEPPGPRARLLGLKAVAARP